MNTARHYATSEQFAAYERMYQGGVPAPGVRLEACSDCARDDHWRHWARPVAAPWLVCRTCKTSTRHVKAAPMATEAWECTTCQTARRWG
jgi:hypothetical protein